MATSQRAKIALLLLMIATSSGCTSAKPSEKDGKAALSQIVDGGASTRLRVESFSKTDGRPAETNGVKVYTLMFSAALRFDSASMFGVGDPLEGRRITTTSFHKVSTSGFSWADYFVSNVQGLEPARRGDRLMLTGTIDFERRESGWVPVNLDFRPTHDSTERQTDFTEESLEQANYSMQFASDAAPHRGLVGGFRNANICLSIDPPLSRNTSTLDHGTCQRV